ncbi:HesA/MoeB/ThiF family protein [Caulobacter mirabilis]|uniref:Molybdopterin-synthase adenylyltransferase n=1 Tax=Caulobacter mirabilis TaxID=69666 RepID=A0A2D2B340_9CAUL|nr:HesA/MoeB/ThiF family protein [Caulobacter mirabilis]ATQ44657.1 molybdopterin biosynthesis protein MoeB [Caulobacter mirabilis]
MTFSEQEVERYARHLVLREIGGPGQQRLKAASVLMVGAGGLGAPAALYLAAAGVGRIGLVDPDTVALSNLQRQVIYSLADIDRRKVDAAAEHLRVLNDEIRIETHALAVTPGNAAALVAGYDLVLDGTDDFATRFAVSDACLAHGKTLVSGAIARWTGQVGVFAGKPCYRCLVPEIPPDAETCVSVGVVGAIGGVIGSMMALEAVKIIAQAGEPLLGRLLIYDALAGETRTVRIGADPACPACGSA